MSYYRRSRKVKENLGMALCIALVILLCMAGYGVFKRHKAKVKNSQMMLTELFLMEGRFNTIGPYLELYCWFQALQETESYYYKYNNCYLGKQEITPEVIKSSDPSQVLKSVRTTFWNQGILLDKFIPADTLKNHMYQMFGKYHLDFLSWPDTSGYRYTLDLSKNKKRYKVTVFETTDHTLDGDTADYWVYDSKTDKISFTDKQNKLSLLKRQEIYIKNFMTDQELGEPITP